MKREKIKLFEELYRINELSGQNFLNNKHLVVVDVQPEYQDYFSFNPYDFADFINENYENLYNLTFLYNGADTLGMVSEWDYKQWLIDIGINPEIVENSNFVDKGYAFFRYCMDSAIDEEVIANFVRFMMDNNINDSRDLNEEIWNKYIEEYGDEDIRDLLEHAEDMISIPGLMDDLMSMSNIVITGGGISECLKEVEIALQSLNKNYKVLTEFTY